MEPSWQRRIERLETLVELALRRAGGPPPPPVSDVAGIYSFAPPGSITLLMAVSETPAGGVIVPAQADMASNRAIGVVSTILGVNSALVVYVGEVTGFVGLVPDAVYYLDPATPGAVTNIAPSAVGQIVQVIGIAKDATTLFVDVSETFVQL